MWVQIIDDASSNLVTTLYTGTGAARDIVTRQNLAGGSLVWIKGRSYVEDHTLFDTERGATQRLISNDTGAQSTQSQSVTNFNSNGFSLGTDADQNTSAESYVTWSFLQKAGFMDIIDRTGTGSAAAVSHALETTVGMILAKRYNNVGDWAVYHRSLGETKYLSLNKTDAAATSPAYWNDTAPDSSEFTVGTTSDVNASGESYVYYVFAHNPAQKIYCGSFTTDGSGNATVTGLGFRPNWLMAKRSDDASDWFILDIERGYGTLSALALYANLSNAETSVGDIGEPTAGGFTFGGVSSATYIYMAIG